MPDIFGREFHMPDSYYDPPEYEYFCELCGLDPAICICPECPVCEEQGNPKCAREHLSG